MPPKVRLWTLTLYSVVDVVGTYTMSAFVLALKKGKKKRQNGVSFFWCALKCREEARGKSRGARR
eukprot:1590094-Rhodomonas_salina.1